MFWKTNLLFRTQDKTFLEQIGPILKLGNIYGTALFTLSEETLTISILLALVLQIMYVVCYVNYSAIVNMYNSLTKFEQAAGIMFYALAIAGNTARSIYSFAHRERHRKIVLMIHKINCSLGMYKRERFLLNVPFVVAISLIISMSFICVITFSKFHVVNIKVSNMTVLLIILHSNVVSDIIDRTIGEELRNLFHVLNDNIRKHILNINGDNIENMTMIAESMNIHRELVKLSLEFTNQCSVSLLVNFELNASLTVCLVHTSIMVTVLQRPYYKYILSTIFPRIIFSLVYFKFVIDTWDLVRTEVTYSIMYRLFTFCLIYHRKTISFALISQ